MTFDVCSSCRLRTLNFALHAEVEVESKMNVPILYNTCLYSLNQVFRLNHLGYFLLASSLDTKVGSRSSVSLYPTGRTDVEVMNRL